MMNRLIFSGLPGIALVGLIVACSSDPDSVAIANPASTHCVESGGDSELVQEANASVGYCRFTDGSSCEEWAFFRGECKPGELKPQ